MKMKILLTASTAFLMALSFTASSQPEPPGNGKEAIHPAPRGPKPGREVVQKVVAFTGEVGNWVTNDDSIYNGFYLQSGGEKLLVKFPAGMGYQLKQVAKAGGTITVNGVAGISPMAEKTVDMVSITIGGKTFYDTSAAAPAAPTADEFVTGSGKINGLQKNQAGDINGFMVDHKILLRVPPHVAEQLSQTAIAGSSIAYSGLKKSLKNGELSSGNYTIVHCQTITINGTQYLTR